MTDIEGSCVHDGSFSYWIGRANISSVSWRGREIVRRLFVTVRDHRWQEVAPTDWSMSLVEQGCGIRFSARHKSSTVDFEWTGAFHIERDALTFTMKGQANRDMQLCRLGLVMLLPVAPLIGAEITVEGPSGTERLSISQGLHPQGIAGGLPQAMTEPFSELLIQSRQLGRLSSRLSGDLFELEDQRNWGDASFKVYCTPLRLGFPRPVAKGAKIEYRVEIQFTPDQENESALVEPTWEIASLCAIAANARIPSIGCVSSGEGPTAVLKSPIAWSHVRVDLDDSELHSATLAGLPAATEIELCINLENDASVAMVANFLRGTSRKIGRVLLRGGGVSLPSQEAISRACELIHQTGDRSPPILIATHGYFVELNRGKPLPHPPDGIAFPLTPTVHASDAWTIAETPAVLGDLVRTARQLSQQPQVSISPLALVHPAPAAGVTFPERLVIPWLLATVIRTAQANVSSITLSADILEAVARLGRQDLLASLASGSRCPVSVLEPAEWADVCAAAVRADDHTIVLTLVNLRKTSISWSLREKNLQLITVMNAQDGAVTTVDASNEPLAVASQEAVIATIRVP